MSKKDVERLSAAIKADANLAAEIKKTGGNLKALIKFAADKGYNFSEKELKAYAKEKKGELTEEQLKKVAGGGDTAVYSVHVLVVA
ncbi:MAG: Nif11-like leader peptide family natural product precursor [Planctomycetota bacterium]